MTEPEPAPGSFTRTFFAAMLTRIGLLVAAMAVSYAGVAVGRAVGGAWGPFLGGVIGLAVGLALVALVLSRTARSRPAEPGR